jgi:hypothetical protein
MSGIEKSLHDEEEEEVSQTRMEIDNVQSTQYEEQMEDVVADSQEHESVITARMYKNGDSIEKDDVDEEKDLGVSGISVSNDRYESLVVEDSDDEIFSQKASTVASDSPTLSPPSKSKHRRATRLARHNASQSTQESHVQENVNGDAETKPAAEDVELSQRQQSHEVEDIEKASQQRQQTKRATRLSKKNASQLSIDSQPSQQVVPVESQENVTSSQRLTRSSARIAKVNASQSTQVSDSRVDLKAKEDSLSSPEVEFSQEFLLPKHLADRFRAARDSSQEDKAELNSLKKEETVNDGGEREDLMDDVVMNSQMSAQDLSYLTQARSNMKPEEEDEDEEDESQEDEQANVNGYGKDDEAAKEKDVGKDTEESDQENAASKPEDDDSDSATEDESNKPKDKLLNRVLKDVNSPARLTALSRSNHSSPSLKTTTTALPRSNSVSSQNSFVSAQVPLKAGRPSLSLSELAMKFAPQPSRLSLPVKGFGIGGASQSNLSQGPFGSSLGSFANSQLTVADPAEMSSESDDMEMHHGGDSSSDDDSSSEEEVANSIPKSRLAGHRKKRRSALFQLAIDG